MYVKIRNWTGDDLTKEYPRLYDLLQYLTGNRVVDIYTKCFEYHNCWIINTDNLMQQEALAQIIKAVCLYTESNVTVKYRQWIGGLSDKKEAEFLNCMPEYEIWINDGSQHSCEVPDYEEDGWFD